MQKVEDLSKYFKTSTGSIYKVPVDEQESWLRIDYDSRQVEINTNRATCMRKIIPILGEPDDTCLFGGTWYISFDDRKLLRKVFSMNLFIPRSY